MASPYCEKDYYVHVYETGPNGKLNLHSLFNYFQDIASEHAERLGYGRNDLMKNNRFWVLSRIYAEVRRWPSWEDTITIRTWPNGTDSLFAMRNYEIRLIDGEYLGSGTSSWLILDRDTKKIRRPEGLLPHFEPYVPEIKSVRNPVKLDAAAEQGDVSSCFRIKVSDLDVNLHTNNVNYLKWVYDTYALEFLMNNDPQSAEINYIAESNYNNEITIRTSSEEYGSFNHSINRIDDSRELCRIKLLWKRID